MAFAKRLRQTFVCARGHHGSRASRIYAMYVHIYFKAKNLGLIRGWWPRKTRCLGVFGVEVNDFAFLQLT
jgi:hypothetical protein